MKLSILSPTLNCINTLEETLKSVITLESKFSGEVELLIGDAGSSDGTTELIEKYVKNYSFIKLYKLDELNIPATLNYLIGFSSGDYFSILNGDDYLLDSFSNELDKIISNNYKGIYCAAIKVASVNSEFLGIRNVNCQNLKNYMSVNHPAMIVHKNSFNMVGKFNKDFPNSYDYCWTWMAFKVGVIFRSSNNPIAYMRLGGISEKKAIIAANEIFRYKYKNNSKFNALKNLFIFYAKFTVKNIVPNIILIKIVKFYRKLNGSIDNY